MFFRPAALLIVAAFVLAGCGRDEVNTYRVAKEDSTPPQAVVPGMNPATPPQVRWTLPEGWQEKTPGQMRVASFTVTDASGDAADVGIIPLPATGQEIQLVNMWREQMKLPPATSADAAAVTIGDAPGSLFDIASSELIIDGKFRARILVAMLTSGGTSWFFKMMGEDTFVASQKTAFLQFLKSIRFDAAPLPADSAPPTSGTNNKPLWTVPAGWQEMPPSEFLIAKFVIAADGDAKAQVNVSQLAGEGGGLMANVNRWRGQLGLPPITQEDDFSKMVESFDANGSQAQSVDMTGTDAKTGQPARLVGVVVPLTSSTWFYKLMGDDAVVARQKDAFLKFIQSAKYANAP